MTAILQTPLPTPGSEHAELVEVLRERLGVRVQDSLRPELHEAVLRACRLGHGSGPEELTQRLRKVPDGHALLSHFAEALSIGETCFYRNPAQLEALVALVAEEIVPQRRARGVRILRLWSAGCATGEEVYTLAALFTAAFPDFLVHVVGADFNARSLAIAREGVYSERAVRGELPLTIERHLTRSGGHWRVSEELRAKTSFVHLNLVRDVLPDPDRGLQGFDVVLCRNVLIYVDESRLPAVMTRLAATAMERCIIGVGPAEYRVAAHLPDFRDCGQALLLRTEALPAPAPAPAPVIRLPAPRPPHRQAVKAAVPARTEAPATLAIPAKPTAPPTPLTLRPEPRTADADLTTLLTRARKLADDGSATDALRALDELLAAFPDASEAHLLAAVLHSARGDFDAAASAYRRALFLDDRSVAAELGLGECHARLGRPKDARRAFWRALRLLEGRDPGETIASLDLPAVAVHRLAQQRLFDLEDA